LRIKQDFVTNSSSTSFLVVCRKELTAENFINNLWNSGLGDKIKEKLIRDVNDHGFPFKEGLHDIHAYSDDTDSLFSQLFYYFDELWWNKILTDNTSFAMREGCCVESLMEDLEYVDEIKKDFSLEFQHVIDNYIK